LRVRLLELPWCEAAERLCSAGVVVARVPGARGKAVASLHDVPCRARARDHHANARVARQTRGQGIDALQQRERRLLRSAHELVQRVEHQDDVPLCRSRYEVERWEQLGQHTGRETEVLLDLVL